MLANPVLLNPLVVAGIPDELHSMGLSGTVYGVLGNDPTFVEHLGGAVMEAPYKAPPKAPVLFVKPRNTLAASGSRICMDDEDEAFEVAVSVGLVIGRTASRVSPDQALSHVQAYVAVADLSIPHAAFYRPSLRFKVRDGSCLVGPALTAAESLPSPDRLEVRVLVNGMQEQEATTAGRVRSAAQLISDVTAFMTLRPGDILLLGPSQGAPIVRAGQRFAVEIEGLAPIEGEIVTAGDAK